MGLSRPVAYLSVVLEIYPCIVQLVALFWRFFFRVTLCEEMASLSLGVLASRFRAIGALVHVYHCWGYGAH
jgi:hypothetical protein